MVLNTPIRVYRPCLIYAPKTELNKLLSRQHPQYSEIFKKTKSQSHFKIVNIFVKSQILIKKISSNTAFEKLMNAQNFEILNF